MFLTASLMRNGVRLLGRRYSSRLLSLTQQSVDKKKQSLEQPFNQNKKMENAKIMTRNSTNNSFRNKFEN
eukprot:Pgem_evm1s17006